MICFVGTFSCPKQLLFYLVFGWLYFFVLSLWWAWENRPHDVE